MGKEGKPLAWYSKGLNFQCTECGKCCTGGPGAVWLTPDDLSRLAKKMNLSEKTFCKQYTRKIGGRLSLTEKADSWDCIFLKGKKCTVYESRPKQCRTFPWWPSNLASKEAWESVECEGIHPDAPLVPFEEIERCRKS